MSIRALRKLQGGKDDLSVLASNLQLDEESETVSEHVARKSTNVFDLLDDDDNLEIPSEEEAYEETEAKDAVRTGVKPKKRNRKREKQQKRNKFVDIEDEDLPEEVVPQRDNTTSKSPPVVFKNILALDQKSLNPENELKRIFGAKIIQPMVKRKQRGRAYVKSSWLVKSNANWAQMGKTGLSMTIDHTKDGNIYFKYEHNKDYRQIQFSFWQAVGSFHPENIVAIVNNYPYHVDSLLQLSDICRMGDDVQMATELVERALYVLESAFHPSFNLATGTSRIEYRQQENRALFLAIFKHLVYIGQRGCYRTALEFCKLLYTLDPENDPMAVILMIDFYAIRAQEYNWFIHFFNCYESKKNLTQLPNFAYAIALAYFYHSKTESSSAAKADEYLQQALLMFPGVLDPLLSKCSIQADCRVTKHPYFGPNAYASQLPALKHLVQLYVGRSYHTWKDGDLLPWLEKNANIALDRIESCKNLAAEFEEKRKRRYQGTPRNIYRHILISEIKDATATLPPDLAEAPLMSYDPLPPLDSVSSYIRPRTIHQESNQSTGSLLSSFFRSLMPSYNPQEMNHDRQVIHEALQRPAAEGGENEGQSATADLRNSVTTLVDAMRDLLGSIHLPELNRNDDESDENAEWD
nr:EOG090X0BCY [Cyclestheria hislopi]